MLNPEVNYTAWGQPQSTRFYLHAYSTPNLLRESSCNQTTCQSSSGEYKVILSF